MRSRQKTGVLAAIAFLAWGIAAFGDKPKTQVRSGSGPCFVYSPCNFPDVIMGPRSHGNVDVKLRTHDATRHLSSEEGDLNAFHAYADAPAVLKIAGVTLDEKRNIGTLKHSGSLVFDVVVKYNDSVRSSYTRIGSVALRFKKGDKGTKRFSLPVPSLRSGASKTATAIQEVQLNLNQKRSTLKAGGLGAIRVTLFAPVDVTLD